MAPKQVLMGSNSTDLDVVTVHRYESIIIRNLARNHFNMTAEFQMLFGPPPYLTLHQFLGFRENERLRPSQVSLIEFANPADAPTPIHVTFIPRGNGIPREMLIPAFPQQPAPMASTEGIDSSGTTEDDFPRDPVPVRVHRFGFLTIENFPVTGIIPTINQILGVPDNEGIVGNTLRIRVASLGEPQAPIRITHIPPPNIILNENEVIYQVPPPVETQQEGIRTTQKRPLSSDANENETADANAPPAKVPRIDSGESGTISTTTQKAQKIPDSSSSVAQRPEENGGKGEDVVEAPESPVSEAAQDKISKGDGHDNSNN